MFDNHNMLHDSHSMLYDSHKKLYDSHNMLCNSDSMLYGSHNMLYNSDSMLYDSHNMLYALKRYLNETFVQVNGKIIFGQMIGQQSQWMANGLLSLNTPSSSRKPAATFSQHVGSIMADPIS